jgi:hypothetical protein
VSYDTKCHELAEHFLGDHPYLNDKGHVEELAETIQQAIEDWIKSSEE